MDVKFSSMMYNLVGLRAFYDKSCMTIGSIALKTFCTKFMKKKYSGDNPCPWLSEPSRSKHNYIDLVGGNG